MRRYFSLLVVLVALFVGVTAHAASGAPPGNNGTVKIKSGPGGGRANEPHVACRVYVEFYGYDTGTQRATVRFDAQSPTGSGTVHQGSASWNGTRNGGKELDYRYGPVDLESAFKARGIAPHPKQGYHVKLTANVTGSQGSDVKHKVFWMEPCSSPGTSTTKKPVGSTTTVRQSTSTTKPPVGPTTTTKGSSTSTVAGQTTTVPGGVTTTTQSGLGWPTTTTMTDDGPGSIPGNASSLATKPARSSGGPLAFTGAKVFGLLLLAAALIGGGIFLHRTGRLFKK